MRAEKYPIFVLFLYFLALGRCSANNTMVLEPQNALEEGITINVTLPNRYKDQLAFYEELLLPPNTVINLQIVNWLHSWNWMKFAVVQVHSFEYALTLSHNSTIVADFHSNGTNLGAVVTPFQKQLFVHNFNNVAVWVSIALVPYTKHSPLPGLCDLHAPLFPMLNVSIEDGLYKVQTPPACGAPELFHTGLFTCGKDTLRYESFYMELELNGFSMASYFASLKKVMSGQIQPKYNFPSNLTRTTDGIQKYYGRNPATAIIFVTYVFGANGWAMYVPALVYSCGCNCCFTITFKIFPSVLAIIVGIFQIVNGILIGLMDFRKIERTFGLEVAARYAGIPLAFFVFRNYAFTSLWIFFGGFTLVFILNEVVINYAGPRVGLTLSNFVVNAIFTYVVVSAFAGTHSLAWWSLLLAVMFALIVTVMAMLPFVGAVLVVAVGSGVIGLGANAIDGGYMYDLFLNPAMAQVNTLADLVR